MSNPTKIYGVVIPVGARMVLEEILLSCGIYSCKVTSFARTPEDQARVMWENCSAELPATLRVLYKDSVHRQRSLYKAPGQAVVDVYAAHRTLSREACTALMLEKILEVGPSKVSLHCAPAEGPVWVVDIGPSSIPYAQRVKFCEAAKAHGRVTKFLEPPADPAYHLEILKESPNV
jgi:hypothetical protein